MFVSIFPSFWIFDRNAILSGTNFKKFTRNEFNKVFIQIPGTYKNLLVHTGTPTNV